MTRFYNLETQKKEGSDLKGAAFFLLCFQSIRAFAQACALNARFRCAADEIDQSKDFLRNNNL
ncbi:hypothetical protein [Rossellomorea arthrocnemi]|jgi:hypothetical protein|uniref:hypothetical protein n=1 Tax=Rossellomorea arthrocnemi TaxID=2769542 RepID=UPI0019186D0A|nr:hypothetical protein [Rossellomorea arthrocnemi]